MRDPRSQASYQGLKKLAGFCAEFVAFEFEVEAAAGESEFAGGARDVAAVAAQGVRDHAALDFR